MDGVNPEQDFDPVQFVDVGLMDSKIVVPIHNLLYRNQIYDTNSKTNINLNELRFT